MVSPTSPPLWLSTPCRRSWPSAPDQAAYGCILLPFHPICCVKKNNESVKTLNFYPLLYFMPTPAHQSTCRGFHVTRAIKVPIPWVSHGQDGGKGTGGGGTQVGADSLIHTVALECLQGPRCCWQVLNGRTARDVTGARWRLISRGIIEELRVDYMISRSKCGSLIFLSLPSL